MLGVLCDAKLRLGLRRSQPFDSLIDAVKHMSRHGNFEQSQGLPSLVPGLNCYRQKGFGTCTSLQRLLPARSASVSHSIYLPHHSISHPAVDSGYHPRGVCLNLGCAQCTLACRMKV